MTQTERIGDTNRKIIKDYEIIKKLGEGGMAEVYLGREITLGNYVAIKKLYPHLTADPSIREKFFNEARIQARLGDHPHIVRAEKFIEDDNIYYIVMSFISSGEEGADGYPLPAKTLSQLIKEGIPYEKAIKWFLQICEAVHYAHTRKERIIHRDLKPSNVMIDKFGNAKVSDFGIAKIISDETSKTRTGTTIGTLPFMAPEQILPKRFGQVGPYTDIYALAIILYKMLTGDYPYDYDTNSSTFEIEKAHIEEMPDLSKLGNRKIREVISRCLEKNPERRYKDIEGLVNDLTGIERFEILRFEEEKPDELVTVPDLVGLTKEQAIALLDKVGLRNVIGYIEGNKDQVLGQDIPGGKRVKKNTVITLVVGIGRKTETSQKIFVPGIIGLEEDKAIEELKRNGLEYVVVGREYSDIYDEGVVISQEPGPSQLLEQGGFVKVKISAGKKGKPVAHKMSIVFVKTIIGFELLAIFTAVIAAIVDSEVYFASLLALAVLELILGFSLKGFLKAIFPIIILPGSMLYYNFYIQRGNLSYIPLAAWPLIYVICTFTFNGLFLFQRMNAKKILRIFSWVVAIGVIISFIFSTNINMDLHIPIVIFFCLGGLLGLSARIASLFKKE